MGLIRPDTVIVNWLLMLPFFAALCAELFPRLALPVNTEREAESLRRGPYLLGALASLMGCLLGCSLLPQLSNGSIITADYWWTKDLYHLRFQADILMIPIVVLICLVGMVLHLHLAGLPVSREPHHRAALLLAAQGCAIGLGLSADIVVLFFFLELTLVALWFSIEREDHDTGNILLASVYVGSLVLLAGLLVIWLQCRETSISAIPFLLVSAEPSLLQIVALLLLIGLLPRLACVPSHSWLISTVSSTPALAFLPALLLPIVGASALLRLLPGGMVLPMVPSLGVVAAALGVATLWVGALRAWFSRTLGHMAAWLTIAHSGYLLLAIGAAASPTAPPVFIQTATLHLLTAPLALLCLWLAVGTLRSSFGTDRISDLEGVTVSATWWRLRESTSFATTRSR